MEGKLILHYRVQHFAHPLITAQLIVHLLKYFVAARQHWHPMQPWRLSEVAFLLLHVQLPQTRH